MLAPNWNMIRLFLHVFAGSVWVGGQIVLAGLVPSLRREHPDAVNTVVRACARIAWPAFTLVVITGVWNVAEVDVTSTDTSYQVTLFVKLTIVAASGAAAAIHQSGQLGRSRAAKAIGGAVAVLGAVAAMFLGYLLTTGS
jgi:putative copper export protein